MRQQRYQTLRLCARGAGMVALIFSLTITALLALDWARAGSEQTIRSEVLEQVLAGSRAEPDNAQSVTYARELDLLARRAYFSSRALRQSGMVLLVFGLLTTAALFGVAWRLSLYIPDPRRVTEADPARNDRLATTLVMALSLALLLTAVILEGRYSRQLAPATDRTLRARLQNPRLKPGEVNVCPCKLGTTTESLEQEWPFMRGPTHSGRAEVKEAPLKWNVETGEGVLWQVEHGGGSSTPAIWGKRIFVTAATAAERLVIACDTESGKLLWQTAIPDGGAKNNDPLPTVTEDTGMAASSPACDESLVYAIFATGDLAAIDHEGKIIWQRYLGRPHNSYGHASSLIYCGEMLIIQWDQEEQARLLALDKKSGRTIWETPRSAGMSWATPIIIPLCDKPLLIIHANQETCGYELATGKELWKVDAVSGEIAPTPTWEGDILLAANCYSRMVAYRLPNEGPPEELWEWDDGTLPDVSSPVVADGRVYLASDGGEVRCHSLESGKELWNVEFDDGFYASPVVAAGRLYAVDREEGLCRVFAAADELQELAVNPTGAAVNATPVFHNNRLYLRTANKLICVAVR